MIDNSYTGAPDIPDNAKPLNVTGTIMIITVVKIKQ
jgi:hypothetical protein